MLWRIQISDWKIQGKCSCAGGSIGKIQIQVELVEDPSPGSKYRFTLEGPLRAAQDPARTLEDPRAGGRMIKKTGSSSSHGHGRHVRRRMG
jgi:hypothetical protein